MAAKVAFRIYGDRTLVACRNIVSPLQQSNTTRRMANVLWGIPVIGLCLIGYAVAWKLARAEHYQYALAAIVLCGLILRIYTGTDSCLHDWDERYHALVAKNLQRHWLVPTLYDQPLLPYDYRNWTVNHVWLHKQPLTLWLMALSIKAFGGSAFAVRIPAILLTTVAIKLVYDIAADWYDKRVAIIAAFLFSIHGFMIELAAGRAGTDSVDAVFLFFVVLSVWMGCRAVRRQRMVDHILLGVTIGLGILTKWLPALIALPVWAITAYPAFKGARLKMLGAFVCIAVAAAAIALPWQLYTLKAFPQEAAWELSYNSRHFTHALEAHEGGFFYYFDHLRMKYGELVYLPVAWATWQGIRSRRPANYAVLCWFWAVYLFFSLAATKMEAYTLIAAPAVFIITALAFVQWGERIRRMQRHRYLLIPVWLCLIALPVRYAIERIKPFTVMDRNPEWNREIMALRDSPANSRKTVLTHCSHPIETMFFTDCTAYEGTLDTAQRQALEQQGYRVLP